LNGEKEACDLLRESCFEGYEKRGLINKTEYGYRIGRCRGRLVNHPRDINISVFKL